MATSSGKRVLLVLLVGVALAAGATAALSAFLYRYMGGPMPAVEPLRAGVVARADVPRLFGVQLPESAQVLSRVGGFQDVIYESLVVLPEGGRDAFLTSNGLTTTPQVVPTVRLKDFEAEVRRRTPGVSGLKASGLEGFGAAGDGGVSLVRQGALLEADDGRVWAVLVAFGT